MDCPVGEKAMHRGGCEIAMQKEAIHPQGYSFIMQNAVVETVSHLSSSNAELHSS
jgi:hypothetical protein